MRASSSSSLCKRDKCVYAILRDAGDVPHVLLQAGDDDSVADGATMLRLRRHGRDKRVLLFATRLHTYVIKRKDCKLYTRFTNRCLLAHASDTAVTLHRDGNDNEDNKTAGDGSVTTQTYNDNNNSGSSARAAAAGSVRDSTATSPWAAVTLQTSSAYAATEVARRLSQLSRAAQQLAAQLAAQEQRGSGNDDGDAYDDDDAASAEDDDSDSDSDSNAPSSDADDAATRLQRRLAMQPLAATRDGDAATADVLPRDDGINDNDNRDDDDDHNTRLMAPSRYTALSSLVDAEFTDYTTLKNAYVRHEEDALLRDLDAFVAENESHVAALCAHHYTTFTHAAQQCLAMSTRDAALVRAELSGAAALVRMSALRLRRVAAALLRSRRTHARLRHVRALLTRTRAMVELLEAAETHMRRQQLSAALSALRALVRAAAPLTDYAVGSYALHLRVPQLLVDAFTQAVRRLNGWLRQLREAATPVGVAALQWRGVVRAGAATRRLRRTRDGCAWAVTAAWRSAALHAAPFARAEVVQRVCSGAAVQRVFYELRQADYFHAYFGEARRLQASTDLFAPTALTAITNATAATTTNTATTTTTTTTTTNDATVTATPVDATTRLVDGFAAYCATALGFVLLEDIVYHATSPHAQSTADVLRLWQRVSASVAQHAHDTAAALPSSSPDYTTYLTRLFRTVQSLAHGATTSVRCVQLSPLVLSRAVEALRDRLVSWRLSDACSVCAQSVLAANASLAARVYSAGDFDDKVARFALHRCGRALLDLPIPTHYTPPPATATTTATTTAATTATTTSTSDGSDATSQAMTLPFCAWVPQVGACVLSFLTSCYRVTTLDRSAALLPSELNNMDDMILKYIAVLFRTVSETLQSQLLLLSSSAWASASAATAAHNDSGSAATERVVPAALFVSSCACMPVLVSCAEQRFMLHWQGSDDGDDATALYNDSDSDDKDSRNSSNDDDDNNDGDDNDVDDDVDDWPCSGHGGAATRQVMGAPQLLASTAALFARPLQAGIDCVLQAYRAEMEQRLRKANAFGYWQQQMVLRAAADKKTSVDGSNNNNNNNSSRSSSRVVYRAHDNAFVAAMDYAIDTIPQLLSILQPTVVRGVVGTGIAHAGMLMQSSIETALGDANRLLSNSSSSSSAATGLLQAMYACVREFELQCDELVPVWQRRIAAALDGVSAAQRFPLHASSTADDLRAWLRKREAQVTAQLQQQQQQHDAAAAAQQMLRSGIEEAGKAVVRGITAVGKTVAGARRDKA